MPELDSVEAIAALRAALPTSSDGAAAGFQPKCNPTAVAPPGVSDDSSESYEPLSLWLDTSAGVAYVCEDAEVGAAVWRPLGPATASSSLDPAASDDSSSGYAVGSHWVNTATDEAFICLDATVDAAVWQPIGSGAAAEAPAPFGFRAVSLAEWTKVTPVLAAPGAQVATYVPCPVPATDGSTYSYACLVKREDTNTAWLMLSSDGVSWSDYDGRATVIDGTSFGGSGPAGTVNYALNVDGTVYVYSENGSDVALLTMPEADLGSITDPTDWTLVDASVIDSTDFTALGLNSARLTQVVEDDVGNFHAWGHAGRGTSYVIWHSKGPSLTDLTSLTPVHVVSMSDTYGTGDTEIEEQYAYAPFVFDQGGVTRVAYTAKTAVVDRAGNSQGETDLHLGTVDLEAATVAITQDPEGRRLITRGGENTGGVGLGLTAANDQSRIYSSRIMLTQASPYRAPLAVGGNYQLYMSIRANNNNLVSTSLAQIPVADFDFSDPDKWSSEYLDYFARWRLDEGTGSPVDSGPDDRGDIALNDAPWQGDPISLLHTDGDTPPTLGGEGVMCYSDIGAVAVVARWSNAAAGERRNLLFLASGGGGPFFTIYREADEDRWTVYYDSATLTSDDLIDIDHVRAWHGVLISIDQTHKIATLYADVGNEIRAYPFSFNNVNRTEIITDMTLGGTTFDLSRSWKDRSSHVELWRTPLSRAQVEAWFASVLPRFGRVL